VDETDQLGAVQLGLVFPQRGGHRGGKGAGHRAHEVLDAGARCGLIGPDEAMASAVEPTKKNGMPSPWIICGKAMVQ
jgi:hypothetical protein